MLEPTRLTTENFRLLFNSLMDCDNDAKTVFWETVAGLTRVIPNFNFDQQRADKAQALWVFYDNKRGSYLPTGEINLEHSREILGSSHSLFLKTERALQLRREMGEEVWRQFLDEYFKDEALIYVLWAEQMKRKGLEHDLIIDKIIARLRKEDSPIYDRLKLIDARDVEGVGQKLEKE